MTNNKSQKTLSLGLALSDMYGIHSESWRTGGTDPNAYLNINTQIKFAKTAEQGGMDYIFMPDRVFLHLGFKASPTFPLDPIVQLSAIASHTQHIGLIASLSTSFNEPYTIARQLRALDLISGGRVGWNVVPSFEPQAFANYGMPVPSSQQKYERLNETVYITQALWGSWQPEAGQPNPATDVFMNDAYIRPINLQGNHVGSRGPLQLPPSPQGQPVLVMPAASRSGIEPAGNYAGVIIGMPNTIEESIQQRQLFRDAATQAGRNADEVKLAVFFAVSLGKSYRDALNRRREMDSHADMRQQLAQLSAMLGININQQQAANPFSQEQIGKLSPYPTSPKAKQVIDLAKAGFSPLDIIAHDIFEVNPTVVGTAEDVADFLQTWFEAGAADSFVLVTDRMIDGLPDFVEQVIPVLKARGLRPDDYIGTTLRENLGLPYELGIDKRILKDMRG